MGQNTIPTDDQFINMSNNEKMEVVNNQLKERDTIQSYMMEETAFEMNECSSCGKKHPCKIKETNIFFKKYCDKCFPNQPEVKQKIKRTIEDIFKR